MSDSTYMDFEQYKKMDLKKVFLETYISYDTLVEIKDKDFKKFKDKVKIKGFIRILEKTYSLNLQSWMDEYLEYYSNHIATPTVETVNAFEESQINWRLYGMVGLSVIMILLIYGIAKSDFVASLFTKDDDQSKTSQAQSEEEITSKLKKALNTKEDNVRRKIDEKTLSIIEPKSKKINKLSFEEEMESELSLDDENLDILDLDLTIDLNQSVLSVKNNDLTIGSTRGRLWIGIVDLDTYQKKSDVIENNKTYPIYDNMIFITGHGHLDISSGGEHFLTRSGDKQYFYYKDKQFIQLKRIEYLYLE